MAFSIYIASPVMTPTDSRYNTHTAYSLLKHGDTDLDEFDIPAGDYRIEHVGGHAYSFFPVWSAVLLVPGVAIADAVVPPLLQHLPALDHLIRTIAGARIPLSTPIRTYELYPIIELIASALLSAGSVAIFFALARERLANANALWATAIFALGTAMWSTVSRALWMHSPSILMLSLALWLLVRAQANSCAQKNPRVIGGIGATLALAFMFRPTNAVAVIAVGLFVAIEHRKQFMYFLLATLPFAGIYLAYNLTIYHHPFASYSHAERLYFHAHFWEALAGNWISPARGLLIFSPALALAAIGFWRFRGEPLSRLCVAIIASHWIVISMYPHWWGGFSYGPRLFSDMLPFFGYGVMLSLRGDFLTRHGLLKACAVAATLASVFINGYGAVKLTGFMNWNASPQNIDQHPERLWDWSDPPFLRGIVTSNRQDAMRE